MPEATPTKRVIVKTDLDQQLGERLKSAAERDNRTAAGYVRNLLTKHLEREPGRRPEADR